MRRTVLTIVVFLAVGLLGDTLGGRFLNALSSPATELFGHVTLVEGYDLPTFKGCHALVALRDSPGTTVAVLTTEPRLQSLLETALQTGALIAFWGRLLAAPPTPRGGVWGVAVYEIDGVIVYGP